MEINNNSNIYSKINNLKTNNLIQLIKSYKKYNRKYNN